MVKFWLYDRLSADELIPPAQDWRDIVRKRDGTRYQTRIAKKGEIIRVYPYRGKRYDLPLAAGEILCRYPTGCIGRGEDIG